MSELKIALSWAPNGLARPKAVAFHAVVGLAAEVIRLGVEIDPIFLAGDLAGREIVDVLDIAGQKGLLGVGQPAGVAGTRPIRVQSSGTPALRSPSAIRAATSGATPRDTSRMTEATVGSG
jgi:hypothetical protein